MHVLFKDLKNVGVQMENKDFNFYHDKGQALSLFCEVMHYSQAVFDSVTWINPTECMIDFKNGYNSIFLKTRGVDVDHIFNIIKNIFKKEYIYEDTIKIQLIA